MFNDVLDLVTGVPLLQSVDFELPFGGAVFRHVRTYSADTAEPDTGAAPGFAGRFWDWQGTNWMMSENPILLIDASYSDTNPSPKRCVLIPDALHAIPFEWDDGDSRYIAPSWHDASLTVNDNVSPRVFTVWLNRRTIRYTFVEHVDGTDIPDPEDCVQFPTFGMLTSIQDLYGNRVELEYCPLSGIWYQEDVEDPLLCYPRCNQIGQLHRVLLRAAPIGEGPGEVVWTLLYVHRAFADMEDPVHEQILQHTLQSVYVYPGEVEAPDDCMTIPSADFCPEGEGHPTFEEVDAIEYANLPSETDWVVRAKYIYGGSECEFKPLDITDKPYAGGDWYYLYKAEVTRRADAADEVGDTRTTIYKYGESYGYLSADGGPLRGVYGPDAVARVVALMREQEFNGGATPNTLLTTDSDEGLGIVDGETVKLRDLADVWFDYVNPCDSDWLSEEGHLGQTIHTRFCEEEWLGSDPDRTVPRHGTVTNFVDHRSGSTHAGKFATYYYFVLPECAGAWEVEYLCSEWPGGGAPNLHPNVGRYPHRVPAPCEDACGTVNCQCDSEGDLALDQRFFVVILDELDDGTEPYGGFTYAGIRSRRIVEMNRAGFIVRDRTWSFTTEGEELVEHIGFQETREFDESGRVTKIFSAGYNAPANDGNHEDGGLIRVFEYEENASDAPLGELRAAGVKRGDDGTPLWQTRIDHWSNLADEHPELVERIVVFPEPVTNYEEAEGNTTTYDYEFFEAADCEECPPAIRTKSVVGPPAPVTLGGADYQPVERWYFDDRGQVDWYGLGNLADPGNPGEGEDDRFFLTHTEYDDAGRVTEQVVDADDEGAPTDAGFVRVAETTEPLAYATAYEYDGCCRLVHTTFPNGREKFVVYEESVVEDIRTVTQRTYNDVRHDEGGYTALSPGEISTYVGGKLRLAEKVQWDELSGAPDGQETYSTLATLTPEYDVHGRLVGMSGEAGEDALEAAISYDGFGQIRRQEDPTGTITHYEYDLLGRLSRTFRGQADGSLYWGIPGSSGTDPDDMVLVEKRYYSDGTNAGTYEGSGINDAGMLTAVRSYRERPDNQYFEEGEDDNNEDEIGHQTLYGSDWRMRQVWVERRDQGDDLLAISTTWYDHQDRVVFQAEYGHDAVGDFDADPRSLDGACELPDAAALLSGEPTPLSLVETRYNARGQAEEVRTYDVSVTSGTAYTAMRTYFNHLNKPVEVHSPNAVVQRYDYDAIGRQVRASSYAGDAELSRTETTFDADGHPIVSHTRERVHDAEDDELDDDNSVSTWVQSWYDVAGRLIATANYGTNNEDNEFANGAEPDYDADDSPAVYNESGQLTACNGIEGLDDWVACTCYGYDEDGRQDLVIHPDGTKTRSDYDGLGRLRLTIENASPGTGQQRRLTAYNYDDKGRLVAMAAAHDGGSSTFNNYTDVDFEGGTTADIQITTFDYAADVLDQEGDTVSGNPSWISAVHYPDRDGSTAGPSLLFTYYMDGAVASREDARGCVLTYTYDDQGRLTRVAADDSAWYGTTHPEPDHFPSMRVHQVDYAYDDRGNLLTVDAENHSDTSPEPICHNEYEYDVRGNLLSEEQSHADISSFTPQIEYTWDYSSADDGNYDRLATIVYPERQDGGTQRQLTFHYGEDDDSIDSLAHRVTAITDNLLTYDAATYTYAGLSRRVGVHLGNGIVQSYGDGGADGYSGLDRFGRTADLNYIDSTVGSTATLHRYQYGYDVMGNRTYARVKQKSVSSPSPTGRDNVRSWLYGYDGMQRLATARMGQLNSTNTAIETDTSVPLDRSLEWKLDDLGNWSEGDSTNGSYIRIDDTNGDGVANTTVKIHHSVDWFNEITEFTTKTNSASPVTTDTVYDVAGNLILDEHHYYQYDAFGRLVQANRKGTLTASSFDDDGRLESGEESKIGVLVGGYVYDGLGRVISRTWPVNLTSACKEHQHFYYDGARRIQEQSLIETSGCTGGSPSGNWITRREYIQGADYIDEYIAEVTNPACDCAGTGTDTCGGGGSTSGHCGSPTNDRALAVYYLQDANYNVVATLDDGCPDHDCGSGTSWSPTGPVSVYEQYTYEPYGQPSSVDKFGSSQPQNPVGHQGLIFDRYCGDTPTDPCILTTQKGLYNNRNRFYHAKLGRFITPDPYDTGAVLLADSFAGISLIVSVNPFQPQGHYADGLSLFCYLRSNSITHTDPNGLSLVLEEAESMSLEAWLMTMGAKAVGSVMALAQQVAGAFLANSYLTSMAVITAGSGLASSSDPAILAAMAVETSRFQSSLNGYADGVRRGLDTYMQGTSGTGLDPNQFNEWVRRFQHTLKHAKEWFGTNNLTDTQLEEWGRLLDYVARSQNTFQWSVGGSPTTAHLARIEGKWLCVQFYEATGELATAFVPSQAQLEEMLRAMGGG